MPCPLARFNFWFEDEDVAPFAFHDGLIPSYLLDNLQHPILEYPLCTLVTDPHQQYLDHDVSLQPLPSHTRLSLLLMRCP